MEKGDVFSKTIVRLERVIRMKACRQLPSGPMQQSAKTRERRDREKRFDPFMFACFSSRRRLTGLQEREQEDGRAKRRRGRLRNKMMAKKQQEEDMPVNLCRSKCVTD